MVMDPKEARKPMTGYDWQVLGHEYYKNGKATLPRRRLDIPLPSTVEECHTIAHRLSALSQAIGETARTATRTRGGIVEISSLIEQARLGFQLLGKEWERELREAEDAAKQPASNEEHLRVVR